MKLDIEYIKEMLQIFVESDKACFGLNDLYKSMALISKDDEKFVFHYRLLCDDCLVEAFSDQVSASSAIVRNQSGSYTILPTPLRLTKDGIDLFGALNESKVLEQIKKVPAMAFSILRVVAMDLLTAYIKKQAGVE
jgi:hypothetical protein